MENQQSEIRCYECGFHMSFPDNTQTRIDHILYFGHYLNTTGYIEKDGKQVKLYNTSDCCSRSRSRSSSSSSSYDFSSSYTSESEDESDSYDEKKTFPCPHCGDSEYIVTKKTDLIFCLSCGDKFERNVKK